VEEDSSTSRTIWRGGEREGEKVPGSCYDRKKGEGRKREGGREGGRE